MSTIGDTSTRVPAILAATLTFLPVAVFTVALRLWVRTKMVKCLGYDDLFIVLALVRLSNFLTAMTLH